MPELFQDTQGDYYTRGCVVFKNIDNPGCQFSGWVTLASARKSNCVSDWVSVTPSKAKLILPPEAKKEPMKIAVLEVKFRGKWTPIFDLVDKPVAQSVVEYCVSEAISQVRIVYLKQPKQVKS